MRTSIGKLMILVVVIALASVAMLRPTRLTASLAFSAAFLALTLSTLVAGFGAKKSRAFASGFAIGGWLSMMVHFGTFLSLVAPSFTMLNGILPTTMILDVLYPPIINTAPPPAPLITSTPEPTATLPDEVPIPIVVQDREPVVSLPAAPMIVPRRKESETTLRYWTEIDRGDTYVVPDRSTSFHTIGFSIFTLIFAAFCGYFTNWIRKRQEPEVALTTP